MPEIRADAIAVYVYRRIQTEIQFLQIHRSAATGEYQQSWQTVYGGVEERVAGGAGERETATQAAVRELKEETGLTPMRMWQVEYLESFYFKPHDYVLVMPVFAVEVAPLAPVVLNAEHDAHRWIPEGQIDGAFMWRTQREALGHLLTALRENRDVMKYLAVDIPDISPGS